jgi:hypothetical protein
MKNNTDCIAVVRSFYTPVDNDKNDKLIYTKEFIFRDCINCRRYCVDFDISQKRIFISNVTEHETNFFDRISEAASGKVLFDTYLSAGIDPVPVKNLNYKQKYEYLHEFFVIYNSVYDEYSLLKSVQGDGFGINYNSNYMVIKNYDEPDLYDEEEDEKDKYDDDDSNEGDDEEDVYDEYYGNVKYVNYDKYM